MFFNVNNFNVSCLVAVAGAGSALLTVSPAAGQSAAGVRDLRGAAGQRGGGERGELHQRVPGDCGEGDTGGAGGQCGQEEGQEGEQEELGINTHLVLLVMLMVKNLNGEIK